ncbi:Coiled-coil domain-containing protein 60 [Bagarius yarrelli]|uniref:Coiled-coil domain-containing protein 60 n=1 Tax=Bagarius yarrelli TaxID=175774 RepID=A0A556VBC4_BAGYA|nr:Coiled-coil domain-containing protein 60 [Bagarius yarrelli]
MSRRLQPCQTPDSGNDQAVYLHRIQGEEFWEKFHPRHKQVFKEVKEKLQVEGTKLEKDFPLKRPKSRKREDIDDLWKHLWHSSIRSLPPRKLLSAVKRGSSYFQLLQEQEEQKKEKRRKKEERRRADHHQSSINDSDIENEGKERSVHGESLRRQSDRRQGQQLRPFTLVHQSLTSDQPQQLLEKHVYRQLCCLCWLLEVLTLERSGKIGPVASCWDARYDFHCYGALKST